MRRHLATLSALLIASLVTAACASVDTESAAPTTLGTTTTVATPSSVTTVPPATTTTTAPLEEVSVGGDVDGDFLAEVAAFLSWQKDDRNPQPELPDGLAVHALSHRIETGESVAVTGTTAEVEEGQVGVIVTEGSDVLLGSNEGNGWRIVGTHPAGGVPWFGEEPRLVMVIGSDARVGTNQQTHRADSIHLLTANPSEGTGTILGFPRDSWVSTAYGRMKFTSLMAGRGPQVMVDHVIEAWGVPVEGYVVTGFEGFEDMMGQIGYLPIILPRSVPTQAWWDGWSAGLQTLSPQRTLEYSRTRKGIPGGDLTRSANQGVVMLAVLQLLQMNDIVDTPEIVALLLDHTWTSLSPTDLIQLGATIHTLDPSAITNIVVPGTLGQAGAASVVRLTPRVEELLTDLADDGLLDEVAE